MHQEGLEKKRTKTNDIVESREGNEHMLRRQGTSLCCAWCKAWGHNSRSFQTKKCDVAKKAQERGE